MTRFFQDRSRLAIARGVVLVFMTSTVAPAALLLLTLAFASWFGLSGTMETSAGHLMTVLSLPASGDLGRVLAAVAAVGPSLILSACFEFAPDGVRLDRLSRVGFVSLALLLGGLVLTGLLLAWWNFDPAALARIAGDDRTAETAKQSITTIAAFQAIYGAKLFGFDDVGK